MVSNRRYHKERRLNAKKQKKALEKAKESTQVAMKFAFATRSICLKYGYRLEKEVEV